MNHEEFKLHMETKFPKMFKDKNYGGFAISEGWFHIIEALCSQIDAHIKWRRNMRAYDLRKARAKAKGLEALIKFHAKGREPRDWDVERAEEDMENELNITHKVNHITIQQIKEKFGGLRFYYDGGDYQIDGMVTMAEVWSDRTCETCGNLGKRRNGGWVRTLCDHHEAEYQANKERLKNE